MDHMSDMTSMDHMHDAHNSQSAHDRNNMPGMNSMHDMNSMNGMHGMSHMDHNHMNHDMTQMTSATKSMMKMHAAMFRRLFWISLVIAIPTVALDPMFASLLHYPVPTTLPWTLIPAALGTVLYFWTGKPFITGGISEIKQKKPGMMLLILLGITVAFVASWLSTLGLIKTPTFWWELALLIVIMLAGHWIEMGSVAGTTSALDAFSSMLPSVAHVVNTDSPADSSTRDVPLSSLKTGQTVLVKPGETIPADGVIVSGTAGVDESLLTGESLPVTRKPGQKVIAGSISTDSALRVRISATGTNTTLSTIQRLVDEAQGSKTPTQLLADRAAALLFWYALLAGAAAFLVWMLVGAGWTVALERLITVLVIASVLQSHWSCRSQWVMRPHTEHCFRSDQRSKPLPPSKRLHSIRRVRSLSVPRPLKALMFGADLPSHNRTFFAWLVALKTILSILLLAPSFARRVTIMSRFLLQRILLQHQVLE